MSQYQAHEFWLEGVKQEPTYPEMPAQSKAFVEEEAIMKLPVLVCVSESGFCFRGLTSRLIETSLKGSSAAIFQRP
jgi:hypothetical protein